MDPVRSPTPGGGPRRAPATWLGYQESIAGLALELYQLTDAIPGHPKGSTVSRETLEREGFSLSVVSRVQTPNG